MIDLSSSNFEVEEENGNVTSHSILFSFDCPYDGNKYIVHTAYEKGEDDNLLIYASYINEEKHGARLMNIENDDIFEFIEKTLFDLANIVKKHENDEEDDS